MTLHQLWPRQPVHINALVEGGVTVRLPDALTLRAPSRVLTTAWLFWQVEHHLWPDLSMLSYQKAAPMVKLICKKHNVPYLQQNVFWRLKKTVDIMIGNTSMRKFPSKWENEPDLAPIETATPH